jgi:predicted RNase H-related nuclease YkuK (DUF458 family)
MELEMPEQLEFRLIRSDRRVDLVSYTLDMISSNPECEVHVGCDSQNFRSHTVYVTTIVFRYPHNGAHVIYRKERVPRINDMWTKLWGETERSVQAAFLLDKNDASISQIDLDFNSDASYPSHKILGASQGYVSSLGFIPKAKPHLLMAVWMANALCQ